MWTRPISHLSARFVAPSAAELKSWKNLTRYSVGKGKNDDSEDGRIKICQKRLVRTSPGKHSPSLATEDHRIARESRKHLSAETIGSRQQMSRRGPFPSFLGTRQYPRRAAPHHCQPGLKPEVSPISKWQSRRHHFSWLAAEHLIYTLTSGTVSTNIFLRRLNDKRCCQPLGEGGRRGSLC